LADAAVNVPRVILYRTVEETQRHWVGLDKPLAETINTSRYTYTFCMQQIVS